MIAAKTQIITTMVFSSRFSYISKKALDEIQRSHGKSSFQRVLMYSKQARHIAKQGFIGFKNGLQQYFKLVMQERIDNKPLTPQQQEIKRNLLQEMRRLKPIALINILPMSPPLLIFYILTYPTKVPSYFCLDEIFELHQHQSIQRQKQAIESFKLKPLDPKFSLDKLSLEELKQLSQLLYGDYEDGVAGINKYMKTKPKGYLIHPHFSKHLAISHIKAELKKEAEVHKQLSALEVEEQVLWKYNRVMSGEDVLVFKSIVEKIDNIESIENIVGTPQKPVSETSEKPQQPNPHHRHSPIHHDRPSEPHERHPHKSQTRKNK